MVVGKVWANFAVFLLGVVILLSVGFYVLIQNSRVESCRKNYEAFNEVFEPFFPPENRTPKQQEDFDTLHETVKELKRGCSEQTSIIPGR